jgi:hypothetical protein
MGSKKTTTTSQQQQNTYAPGAMEGYQQALNVAKGLVANPYGNPFYQQTLTQGLNAANQMGQNNMSNLMANLSRSGIGQDSAAGAMLRQMGGYMNSHNQANAFLNAANQAQQMWGSGMNMLSNPLVTGATANSKSVEQTGGLGTWLPQVAGAAIGGITGGLGGGLMGALNGAGSAMGVPGISNSSNLMGGFMGSVNGIANPALNRISYMPYVGNPNLSPTMPTAPLPYGYMQSVP